MSDTQSVQGALEAKFPFLSGGAVKMQRERRLWVEVAKDNFAQVFDHLVTQLGCTQLCTITGLDEGADLGIIYHLARDAASAAVGAAQGAGERAPGAGVVVSLKTKCPKGQSMKTVSSYFPVAVMYERELIDMFGAKVDGLPPGPRYPLPEDWPADEHPLLKDWPAAVGTPDAARGGTPSGGPAAVGTPDAGQGVAPTGSAPAEQKGGAQ